MTHDLPMTLARLVGAQPLTSYAIGLALVVWGTLAAWAVARSGVWSRARQRVWRGAPEHGALLLRGAAGLAVIVLAAAAFAEVAEHIGADSGVARADEWLAATLRAGLAPRALQTFAVLTHAGDAATLAVLGVGLALALWAAGHPTLAVGWVMAVGGNAVLNPVLKRVFERVRPLHDHGYTTETGWSFPSGHSSGAMVAYGMLAYLGLRRLPPRWHLPALLLATALIYTTGCSRIFLQVHYASDVVAGFASGLAWLMVCVLSLEARAAGTAPH